MRGSAADALRPRDGAGREATAGRRDRDELEQEFEASVSERFSRSGPSKPSLPSDSSMVWIFAACLLGFALGVGATVVITQQRSKGKPPPIQQYKQEDSL